jgi:methanogenic corrinoid protein MtbC1
MDNTETRSELVTSVADLDETVALSLVQKRLEQGDDPLEIINDCEQGMRLIGERYEKREYYLSALIMAGEIFRQVIDHVQPKLEQTLSGNTSRRVLLGTVQGDIHDIGKDIIHILLRCFGFTVEDLGVNVPPHAFLERALATQPDFIGLSGILTSAFDSMAETVRMLRTDTPPQIASIPIFIGGSQVNEDVCNYVGADYWASEGTEGIRLFKTISERQS